LICPQETFLGQGIRRVSIFGQQKNDPVYPALMLPDDGIESVRRYFDGILRCAAGCAQDVYQGRFHRIVSAAASMDECDRRRFTLNPTFLKPPGWPQ
jgi:hypothetical protein